VEFGPGQLSVDEVGIKTIATTTVVDARRSMAYAAAIGETNPAYFDRQPTRRRYGPGIAFSLQWNSRFRPDLASNNRAASFGVHAFSDLKIFSVLQQGQAVTTQGQLLPVDKSARGSTPSTATKSATVAANCWRSWTTTALPAAPLSGAQ